MMKKAIFLFTVLLIVAITACAEESLSFSVLSYQYNSGLRSLNHYVNDSTCPIKIVNGSFQLDRDFHSRIQGYYRCQALSPVTAFEVRILLCSAHGRHLDTLGAQADQALDAKEYFLSPQLVWHVPHRNLDDYATTVFFIAKVQMKDGQVWKFHPKELSAFINLGIPCFEEDLEVTADPPSVAE
jgi:hypothetical protein